MTEHTPFAMEQARVNLIRYEECERISHILMDVKKDFEKEVSREASYRFYDKHTLTPLTHAQVYAKGLDEAMDIIDGRMTQLTEW